MKMLFLVAATVALPTLTMAQSKIECVLAVSCFVGTRSGEVEFLWSEVLVMQRGSCGGGQ